MCYFYLHFMSTFFTGLFQSDCVFFSHWYPLFNIAGKHKINIICIQCTQTVLYSTRSDCWFYSREICLMKKNISFNTIRRSVCCCSARPSEIWSENSLIQQNRNRECLSVRLLCLVFAATTNHLIFSICFMKYATMNLVHTAWQIVNIS